MILFLSCADASNFATPHLLHVSEVYAGSTRTTDIPGTFRLVCQNLRELSPRLLEHSPIGSRFNRHALARVLQSAASAPGQGHDRQVLDCEKVILLHNLSRYADAVRYGSESSLDGYASPAVQQSFVATSIPVALPRDLALYPATALVIHTPALDSRAIRESGL